MVDGRPAALGGSAQGAGAVQRRIRLAGSDLDAAHVHTTADTLVRTKLNDIVPRPVAESLVRETVRELQAASDLHDFASIDDMATSV